MHSYSAAEQKRIKKFLRKNETPGWSPVAMTRSEFGRRELGSIFGLRRKAVDIILSDDNIFWAIIWMLPRRRGGMINEYLSKDDLYIIANAQTAVVCKNVYYVVATWASIPKLTWLET